MNGEIQKTNGERQDRYIVTENSPIVAPGTIIIDIISKYRHTEPIFKQLEEETGVCVLCQGLFLTLGEAARQFGFDLENVLRSLHAAVDGGDDGIR